MEKGICPICGSDMLEYGSMELADGDSCYFEWHCEDCDANGKEWYELEFVEHTVKQSPSEGEK